MQPPRPPVTIRDPTRPLERGSAPLQDEQAPPATPRGDRRWGRPGLAVVLAAVVVLVGLDVRADRVRAEQERRLDGVVQLELVEPGSYDGAWRSDSGEGRVELAVRLRNTGPRAVVLTGAEQGDLRFVGEVALPAQDGTAVVRLTRSVACPPAGQLPEPEPEGRPLVLQVVTPAGPREAVLTEALPIGSLNEGVQASCGYPPLRRAVEIGGGVLGQRERVLDMRVEVANTSRWEARLTSLFFGRGLTVISIDGSTDRLPMPLPPASERAPTVLALDVVVGLSCSAYLVSPPVRPLEEVNIIVDDGSGTRIGQLSHRLADPEELVRRHAAAACLNG